MAQPSGTAEHDLHEPLYRRSLGPDWQKVAEPLHRVHCAGAALERSGRFRISAAKNLAGRLLAEVLRLPRASDSAEVKLRVTPSGELERWERWFDGQRLATTQRRDARGRLVEQFGCMEFCFCLRVENSEIVYEQVASALLLGPLRVPLPRILAPRIAAREEPAGPRKARVTVTVTLPLAGLLIAYDGCLDV